MSKTLKKKKHWSSKVQECAVSWGTAELSAVLEIRGGAEHGEFPHLGQVLSDALVCHVGRLPGPGDVLLEVNGTPVSGLTNRDTLAVIRHFREPLRLKTVKPGNYYGTPKPPAEPSPVQPDLVDQVLFDEEFDAEVQRKRTTSVSKMDRKDSAAPEEEEEDESFTEALSGSGPAREEEGPEWRKAVPSYTQSSSSMDFRNWNTLPRDESQEPLPKNWEMAYTETGMVYFIDHNTKTTTWLDPRLAKKAKPPEKCEDGELPYGWEKIEDPQYGTYYVDHINQKTQFENPVQEAKKKLSQDASPTTGLRGFTRDPSQLQGAILCTTLKKSLQGFGFTIIGGDRPDEFLQVKNVLRDGPAAHDNKIASGDVIVDINGTCVLGKTHADVVQMFQSIPVNQYVDMILCRGYPLPEDTNSSEEGTGDIITSVPGIDGQPVHSDGTPSMQDLHYMTTDGRHPAAAMPNGRFPEAGDTTLLQPELVSVPLVKGPSGFGFAIADCPLGQKVKMILDAQWCRGLLKGDVIKEINRQNVQTLTHAQVVDILKDLPVGSEVNVLVLRGAIPSTQKQDIATSSVSTETPSAAEPGPQSLPFPPHAIRSSSPKLDPSELYLKSKALLDSKPTNTKELDVFIRRNQETGFGFRVLGGEGPDQPVYIGAIVPLGAAEKDGRLRAGDELICIDGVPVKGKSHKQVLELMTNAARNGQVMLTVRRKLTSPGSYPAAIYSLANGSPKPPHIEVSSHSYPQPYDVTLQRKDNEGFGFVILTSKNKPPPGVIPHKIGRIIDGSPTDRCGRLKVGDRISAVNGQSIIELSHNDIVQLIKEAGNAVTLTVVPEEEHSGPPSGTSSAKQSPASQHRAVGQQPANREDRNGVETEERKDTVTRAEYKSLPQGEMGAVISSGPKQGCYPVELERGQRGFGFSLRGGKEYNMGLFILRLAEDGPALKDGRIHVGDQIVEINGEPTHGITHTRAIELIQAGGNKVMLLLRPGLGLVPDHNTMTGPSANSPRYSASNEPSTPASSSFISHSPEVNPSPPEELFFDPVAASHRQLHQHYRDAKKQTRKSDSTMPRDNHDSFTLPRRQDGKERSGSPKKTLNMDNKNDPSGREARSPSPRKTKKENAGIRQEVPQKATDGLKPNSGSRYKDEDTMHKQDRETGEIRPEVSRGGSDRYQRDKTAEPQWSESSTLNRKDHRGRDRPRGEEDIEGVPQETPQNGNPTTKRAPITPGPWKVPSSARIQPPVHRV
uniref:Membrane-associated guanylate kinase, WW and PDZ domain-containing protein 3 n=1 Tax=Cyprinus carpio TaxID=7962 RepID=A0A8C1JWQ0_CYPCA